MSGTMGGVVASHNRNGQYFRRWTKPTDPQSATQLRMRDAMGRAVLGWKALTVAQQATWDSYAAGTPWTNKLGEVTYLTGFHMYVRSCSFLVMCQLEQGFVVELTEGVSGGLGLPQGLGSGGNSQTLGVAAGLSLGYDDTMPAIVMDGGYCAVYMSKPRPISSKFDGGPRRLVAVIPGEAAAPPPSPLVVTTANLPFVIEAGQRTTVTTRAYHATGRLSETIASELIIAV
jgi:hypothetical protein